MPLVIAARFVKSL